MTEAEFDAWLYKMMPRVEEHLLKNIPDEEKHVFSEEFERKMAALINGEIPEQQ